MDKQEILDEINKTKEHLANMEKMLEEYKNGRWKPKEVEEYYYVGSDLKIFSDINYNAPQGINLVKTYNCFKTEDEAQQEADKILVRRQLEDIARRLNKGRKIDWDNFDQNKYFIYLDCATQLIRGDCDFRNKIQGVVYCLSDNFVSIAKREIGEERLKKYLRGE